MTGRVRPRLTHHEAIERAVDLALLSPQTGPNPRVGAVIVAADGTVLGEGFHHGAGTPHAEVEALKDAANSRNDVVGATAYVSLEPCNHTGRTGPCAQALIDAGITTVFYTTADPHAAAAGGAARLTAAGVRAEQVRSDRADAVNRRWLSAMSKGRPHVIAKWGQTLDGYIAAMDGSSFWITGDEARDHAHHERARVDAIVVGTGTVIADNPSLSARPNGVDQPHQPLRVVMGLRDTHGAQVWRDDNALSVRSREPKAVLEALWEREVRTVVVEGGSEVLTAFVSAGLVDELQVYIAPMLLGSGTAAINGLGIATMSQALRMPDSTWTTVGADTLLHAFVTEGP